MKNTGGEGNNFGGTPPKKPFSDSCGVFRLLSVTFKKGHQTVGIGPIRAGMSLNGHIQTTLKIGKP